MSKFILDAQRDAYRANLLEWGEGPKGTLQNDLSTQHLRFHLLLKELSPHFGNNATLHDLGSGLSDLNGYLIETGHGDKVVYSGTEIVDEMIEISRRKYPGIHILNRNLLDASNNEKYDFSVASGTFNLLGGIVEAEWRELCFALITKMFSMSRKAISFNVLTSYRTFTDDKLCYFDPRELYHFLTTRLSRFVVTNAASPLYEVTFTVFQEDYLHHVYSDEPFRKYFKRTS